MFTPLYSSTTCLRIYSTYSAWCETLKESQKRGSTFNDLRHWLCVLKTRANTSALDRRQGNPKTMPSSGSLKTKTTRYFKESVNTPKKHQWLLRSWVDDTNSTTMTLVVLLRSICGTAWTSKDVQYASTTPDKVVPRDRLEHSEDKGKQPPLVKDYWKKQMSKH